MKKVIFYTLGCKVNQYETQSMREQFILHGYEETTTQNETDICVINTCTVTATSDRKSRQLIREAIRTHSKATVVVTGCYAQGDAGEIAKIPGVDFIVGNDSKHEMAKIIQEADKTDSRRSLDSVYPERTRGARDKLIFDSRRKSKNQYLASGIQQTSAYSPLKITTFKDHTRTFVKIQDGCDNFCSYCKVPLVRGRARSRQFVDIIDEAKRLVNNGYREIVLSGICLGAYGRDQNDGIDLADVIDEIESIEGTFRIRLSSLEPLYITDRLIERMVISNKLCRHLHLPLQSGDDDILKRMNRNYSAEEYKKLIEKIKLFVPHISITTDVLVGFPGESDSNFANTLKLIEHVVPSRTHIFPYSAREGTAAFGFDGRVDHRVIKKRINTLRDLTTQLSFQYRRELLGTISRVLVESRRDRTTNFLRGYTDSYIEVHLQGSDDTINKLIPVKIVEIGQTSTLGQAI